jgi:hypothetical protein
VQAHSLLPRWEQFQAGNVTLDFQAELFDMIDFDPFVYSGVATAIATDTLAPLPPQP